MKKILSIALAITTLAWLGAAYVPVANAAVVDGDIVSATAAFVDADGNTYQAYDVFIVKIVGSKTFKRLILNPQVFTSYGHLKWSNLKKLSADTVKGYTTAALVRVINDEKVYKLMPDGDTGTKQWVDDLTCFNSKGYDWDSVYIINAVDGGNYTTGGSICGTGAITGNLNLSLASNNPLSATIPLGAYGVTFMKVNVSGSGTISQLVIKRSGAGSADDFDNVYIYENGKRLGSGRTISTSTNKATFIGLSVVAPTTIDVVADLSSTNGYQDRFSIESASDVTANATIGGSFPIDGNLMTANAVTAGTLTVARNGSTTYNITVGAQEAEISAFKVTTVTEASKISRIQLYQGGTITPSKITDLKLKTGDVTVATADKIGDDGYVVFNLATPKEIAKGSSAIFYVYADVTGKPAETVKLYLDEATDILGIGQTYGYGMKATITNYASGVTITGTLVGGDLTLVKDSSVVAGKIGLDTQDTVFLALTMSAAADITISRTRLALCDDLAGAGADYETLSAATGYFSDVEDVKITNKDTGVVIAGPQDGSAFQTVTSATVGGLCPGDKVGLYKDFTDNFDLTAGQSINLKVTADVVDGNTAETNAELVSGSVIKLIWVGYGTVVGTDGTISYMKYTGTNNAVKAANIVPSSDIAGEEMTLAAASLTVTLAGTPAGVAGTQVGTHVIGTARTYVTGQLAVPVNAFIFTAGSASDMKVTTLTLDAYVNCNDAASAYGLGLQDTNCYTKNLVSSVEIWDTTLNTMVPGSIAKGFTGTNYSDIAYTGLNWTIPAGESRTLLVKANLSSIIPSDSTNFDAIAFAIALPADITTQDKDGTSVDADATAINGSTTPTISVAIYSYGSIAVAAANDTPDQNALLMGSTNNEVSKYKLTATRESFNIDTFSVGLLDSSGEEETADRTNITGVAIKYQTASQYGTSNWTVSSKKGFGATATIAFTFSGDARPYVPKDDSSYITALADIDGYNAGTGAHSGDYFTMMVATGTNEIKLYGAQSGHLLNSATQLTTGFNSQYIYRSKPFFEKVAWTGDNLELARFSITALGYDVTFDGTLATNFGSNYTHADVTSGATSSLVSDSVGSAAIEFDVIASGTDSTLQTLYLYDWNNSILSSVSDVTLSHADAVTESMTSSDVTDGSTICSVDDGITLEACITSVSFMFETASTVTIIPQGTTKTFYVMLDNANDFNNTDEYIYLKLNQNEGNAAGNTNRDNCSIVWSDGTNNEGGEFDDAICMPANMKNIGAFPFTFRTLTGTTAN
jgi:hypothetical protein